ncbi:MAG TPA: 4-hydroxy-tetrahydrodipicolinate synthase [Clostridia bacterium]|nr:4-hydroxy-tetrahydrodipicolinate synthase [Clostridia bacterium]
MKSLFTGSAVAIVTPFTHDGVDFETMAQLLDFQISNGTKAIIVCGTTGEPSTMSKSEKLNVMEFAIAHVKKRVPVIAGTGCNCTADTIELSRQAEKMGADGLLVVTPYYNKCTQNGLIAHYTAIADAVNIPIIAYNVPGRTCVNIRPATMKAMSEHENIVGIKEASGDITQIADMCALCEGKADVYSGDDALTFSVLALGGKGVISVAANIVPKFMSDLCEKFFAGDLVGARKMQFKLNPLVSALFCEVNPIPVKTALSLMGYRVGNVRLPLTPMADSNLAGLKQAMKDFGI